MASYKYYEIPVSYLASGLQLRLPVHEFGEGGGKTIGITAGIHGDETISVEIARRVVEALKKEDIKGTVKVISTANPLGFGAVNRNTPEDQVNMNRIFPGYNDGTVTEQQANAIATQFLDTLDAYIDIHAGGQDPVVHYTYVLNDEGLSRASLNKILYRPTFDYEGTSATYTLPKKIPTATLECGGGPNEVFYAETGLKSVMNMLRYLGAIDGKVESRDDQVMISHIEHVCSLNGGLYVPALTYDSMGTILEGEVVLGRVYNPMTLELLEELKTPYDRNLMILMRCNINRILAGDFTFMIGDLSTEIK